MLPGSGPTSFNQKFIRNNTSQVFFSSKFFKNRWVKSFFKQERIALNDFVDPFFRGRGGD